MSAYSTAILAFNPLGYFRFGEAAAPFANSGSVVTSGTITAATVTTGVTGAIAGDPNKAIGLSGGGYVSIPDTGSAWDFGSGDFTYSIWFQTSSTALSIFIGNAGNSSNLDVGINTGGGYFANIGAVNHTDAVNRADGLWHNAVFTRTTGVVNIYMDGGNVLLNSANTNSVSIASALNVGCQGSGGVPFTGNVDELVVLGQGLTGAQVSNLYTLAITPPSGGGVIGGGVGQILGE